VPDRRRIELPPRACSAQAERSARITAAEAARARMFISIDCQASMKPQHSKYVLENVLPVRRAVVTR
jgi:hypothetical protein